ncbi:MAG TPA: hypothetical protein VHM27_04095 [Rhizomicrobium sp.]|nr:hypothetical protein [Rhizomicrobium sp.]
MRYAAMLATAAALLLPVGAFAADLRVEISAAQIAARSGSRNVFAIDDIHERMQASINCLVGPKGADFVASVRNPCATTGNGVIPDTPEQAKKDQYMQVVTKLKSGLKLDDRAAAMQIALDAADMIVATSE